MTNNINISKEKECHTLWSFIAPTSENVAALASALAKTCETIEQHYGRLTKVEDGDEPNWRETSMMLLGTIDGFTDYVREYCLSYVNMLQELKKALSVSEEAE
jgi:hypothetical protein